MFSYFFLKGALLFNYSKFINFCRNKNKGSSFLEFSKNKEIINEYIQLIHNCWKNKDFHNCIQKYMKYILNSSKLNKTILGKTLKLTSTEFNPNTIFN